MTEKLYWIVAGLGAAVIIYVGVALFQPVLTTFHILVSLLLILVVLLQSGRAADLAGAFGGAGSQTAFGPRGAATLLSNATTFLAVVFMVTSLALAIFASAPKQTSLAGEAPASEQTSPAPGEPSEGAAPPPSESSSDQQSPDDTSPAPQQ
ncbi:MAG: preprotein translocase subunit SecG [Terriglobia bacterium]